jgi:hypothetical protein
MCNTLFLPPLSKRMLHPYASNHNVALYSLSCVSTKQLVTGTSRNCCKALVVIKECSLLLAAWQRDGHICQCARLWSKTMHARLLDHYYLAQTPMYVAVCCLAAAALVLPCLLPSSTGIACCLGVFVRQCTFPNGCCTLQIIMLHHIVSRAVQPSS